MNKTYATIALSFAATAPLANGQLTEDFKLTANDAAMEDRFGHAVAVSGTTAVVGSRWDDDWGSKSGAAYIFDTTTGQQLFKIASFPPLASAGAEVGFSVAVSGDTAVIGAPFENIFSAPTDSGAAYIFDASTGGLIRRINAVDAGAGDEFGNAVAISGDAVVVGAWMDGGASNHGSAYIFDAATVTPQLFKLTPSDSAAFQFFGGSVAVSGTTAIIGAEGDNHANIEDSGSAYLFDTTTGQELFKLTASDAEPFDFFGWSVAISGSLAIVGTPWSDDAGNLSGSAYIFDTTSGQELFKLTASDAQPVDLFGDSVAISGSLAIIGASGVGGGAVYLFDATTGQELLKFTASDIAGNDFFGWSIGLDGSTAVVGSVFDDDVGSESGSAYVFDVMPCPGDIADSFGILGPDGMVDFGDFLALLGLVGPCPGNIPGCTGDIADSFGILGPDGMVDFGDFLALLGLVGPCP